MLTYLTEIERTTLLAYIRYGNYARAAYELGVPVSTVKNRLYAARERVHASTTPHLAAILYPIIGHLYVIEHTNGTIE